MLKMASNAIKRSAALGNRENHGVSPCPAPSRVIEHAYYITVRFQREADAVIGEINPCPHLAELLGRVRGKEHVSRALVPRRGIFLRRHCLESGFQLAESFIFSAGLHAAIIPVPVRTGNSRSAVRIRRVLRPQHLYLVVLGDDVLQRLDAFQFLGR